MLQFNTESVVGQSAIPMQVTPGKASEAMQDHLLNEKIILTIQGKYSGGVTNLDGYVQALKKHPYMQDYLSPNTPVRIKSTGYVDDSKFGKMPTFTIECMLNKRKEK